MGNPVDATPGREDTLERREGEDYLNYRFLFDYRVIESERTRHEHERENQENNKEGDYSSYLLSFYSLISCYYV